MRVVKAFWKARAGATSIEYALIAGVVSLAVRARRDDHRHPS